MERVNGVGGVFLKARDPKALAQWYRDNLGLPIEGDQVYGVLTSKAADEHTVWAAFRDTTSYFGSAETQFMVNYRVSDLDAMLAQLRRAGAEVDQNIQQDVNGRFGWATDPEGNRFELWQPPKR